MDDPSEPTSNTDKVLPKRAIENTEKVAPRRMNDLNDNDDAI
jgi:hypothetical protein